MRRDARYTAQRPRERECAPTCEAPGGVENRPLKVAGGAGASMIADRLDGKVPQPTGGSDELGPQRLHVSWRLETQPNCTLAAATQDVIEINERDPRVRCAGPQQAGAAQEADAKEP